MCSLLSALSLTNTLISCLSVTFCVMWYDVTEMYMPTATSARRQGLRSVTTGDLVIPRVTLATYCSRAFSVAGLVCWNILPDYLKSLDLSFDCFKHQLNIVVLCIHVLGRIVLR